MTATARAKPKRQNGQALRDFRNLKGLSLRQVSQDLGMSEGHLSLTENEKVSAELATLVRLADHYGISVESVLRGYLKDEVLSLAGANGRDAA